MYLCVFYTTDINWLQLRTEQEITCCNISNYAHSVGGTMKYIALNNALG